MSQSEVKDCGWCLNKFVYEGPKEPEKLRKNLLICDTSYEPIICGNCFSAIGSYLVRPTPYILSA